MSAYYLNDLKVGVAPESSRRHFLEPCTQERPLRALTNPPMMASRRIFVTIGWGGVPIILLAELVNRLTGHRPPDGG